MAESTDLQAVEAAFDWYLHLLNGICGKYVGWSRRHARKEQHCEFGCTVRTGAAYFRKLIDPARTHDLRLCEDCMKRLLHILFATDAETAGLAAVRLETQYGSTLLAMRRLDEERSGDEPERTCPQPKEQGRRKEDTDRLARVRAKSPRAYEKWSAEEDRDLQAMLIAGRSVPVIARRLQRQASAISSRIAKLGLGG